MLTHNHKLTARVERILTQQPGASSHYIYRRLSISGASLRMINATLQPFYQQGQIDDSTHIERAIKPLLAEHQGLNQIKRHLQRLQLNPLQVAATLVRIGQELDAREQAQRCKVLRFGGQKPSNPDEYSAMLFYLQKQGHTLPIALQVLRE